MRPLSWGVTLAVIGIALSLFADPTFGGVVTVLGVLSSVLGLHRLGRSGRDPRALPRLAAAGEPEGAPRGR